MIIRKLPKQILILLVLLCFFNNSALAKPLLIEGKKTLYQRVLTTPNAEIFTKIDATYGKKIPAFSVYYVYNRQEKDDVPWLEIGSSVSDQKVGWVKEEYTVPWKQQIVLAFSNSAGREPNLLFSSKEKLVEIWENENPESVVKPLREKVLNGKPAESVISIEPENYINFQDPENFYLLPILSHEQTSSKKGPVLNLLEVASVTKKKKEDLNEEKQRKIEAFKACVVFVIDTTISMGPYIDETHQQVKNIYDVISKTDLADHIKFGLVAYRSNVDAVPALEYTSKLYVDPNEVETGEEFLEKVKDLKPATVSTPSFSEDMYAGIMTALRDIDWSAYSARYIVVISDAGAINADNSLSTTGLNADNIRQEASENRIALFSMHLKTEAGKKNHYTAQEQYEELTSNQYTDNLYYSIDAGDVNKFGSMVEGLTQTLTNIMHKAYFGDEIIGNAGAEPRNSDKAETQNEDSAVNKIKKDAEMIGKAMRLAYLGRVEQTKAPDFFKAWLSDTDFSDLTRDTVDYRVLLTRKQLNDLDLTLSGLLEAFENAQTDESRMSSMEFYDSLRSIAVKMGKDPEQLADPELLKLKEIGLFGEYIKDLPNVTPLMEIDFEDWETMDYMQQDRDVLNPIRRKLRQYKIINEDSDRWVVLTKGAPASEAVYPVPLEILP